MTTASPLPLPTDEQTLRALVGDWIDRSFTADGDLIGLTDDRPAPSDSIAGADNEVAVEMLATAFRIFGLREPYFDTPESRLYIRAFILRRFMRDNTAGVALPEAGTRLLTTRFPWEHTPRGLLSPALLLEQAFALGYRAGRLTMGALRIRIELYGTDHPKSIAALIAVSAVHADLRHNRSAHVLADFEAIIANALGDTMLGLVRIVAASLHSNEPSPVSDALQARLASDASGEAIREVARILAQLGQRAGKDTPPAASVAALLQARRWAEMARPGSLASIDYDLGFAQLVAGRPVVAEASLRRSLASREQSGDVPAGANRMHLVGLCRALCDQGKEEGATMAKQIAELSFDAEFEIRPEHYLPLVQSLIRNGQESWALKILDRALSVSWGAATEVPFLLDLADIFAAEKDSIAEFATLNQAVARLDAETEAATKEGREPIPEHQDYLARALRRLAPALAATGRIEEARIARERLAGVQQRIDEEMLAAQQRGLERFIEAHKENYDQVLHELRGGRRETEWAASIFPPLKDEKWMNNDYFFSMTGLAEARAYLSHPVLGGRLNECAKMLLNIENASAHQILGSPGDATLHSCATLFARVSGRDSVFQHILDKYFFGVRDPATLALLDRPSSPG